MILLPGPLLSSPIVLETGLDGARYYRNQTARREYISAAREVRKQIIVLRWVIGTMSLAEGQY